MGKEELEFACYHKGRATKKEFYGKRLAKEYYFERLAK